MRCFLSLAVPEAVADRMSDVQEGLPGATWTPDENMHVTLAFLGDVDRRLLEDLDSLLSGVDSSDFELEAAGLGDFGGVEGRVAFARIVETPSLMRLQKKVATAAREAGAALVGRRYTPHVTLARWSRGGVRADDLRAFVEAGGLFRAGPWPAEAVRLMRSDLGRGGALHTELAAYPLG